MNTGVRRYLRGARTVGFVPGATLGLVVTLGLALAPAGALARNVYVANFSSNTISVIDSRTNQLSGPPIELKVADGPFALAVTPDGSELYVTDTTAGQVSVVDVADNRVVGPPIAVGAFPVDIALTPDGAHAYVANSQSGSVSVIDTATKQVVGLPIVVGDSPLGIALTPDGARAYVINSSDGDVSVIDTRTNQVVGEPIVVGTAPRSISISPDGARAYVTNSSSDSVSVIDTGTNQVVGEPIKVGVFPFGIAVTPDGDRVYVAARDSGEVSAFDARTGAILSPATGLGEPEFLAIAPDGKSAYVSIFFAGKVAVVDTQTNQVKGQPIALGAEGSSHVAIVPDQPPVASFSTRRARPGVPVAFSASASKDPDGSVASYAWDFGDGQTTMLARAATSHVYRRPGSFPATLTLTDDEGCSTQFVFTGQTASCNGSAGATLTQTVKVAFPGVRVSCPRGARPGGCRFALQAVGPEPRGRRKAKAQSAVARVRVGPGQAKVVSLKPRRAFRVRLSRAKTVRVRVERTVSGVRGTSVRRLKIVQ